ncbi:pseudouridylate synthase [Mucilaginibacter sp. MD40]|uniref:pseudouridine synthase n=1 Tax=Mucilaginibacter sp. MD40 TaxID=2029590 RepID=UPI000BAC7E98|nr:pseudouridine synthase [Mucilaginibacter sp. MD40]PAW92137.1 pseudouridylate synthase [Mucilaginibacter sp. MD40]
MVFKRPAGSREDRPNRQQGHSKSGADNNKKTSSSAPYGSRDAGKKPYGDRRQTSTNPKPFSRKASFGDNEQGKSFDASSSGDRRSFAPKGKPYSGKPESSERPYGTRNAEGVRTNRGSYGEQAGGKKGFGKSKPFGDKPQTGERRSFGENRGGYTNSTGKKDFKSTTSGYRKREDRDFSDKSEGASRTMRGRKNAPAAKAKDDGLMRLNRYIANAGICSRRKADELIEAGVISVNGEVVSELGYKVDPFKDVVRYNGEPLKREKMVYVLLNKPKDYITTTDDPQERRTVMHLVEKASRERIYPVGRLDRNTTGLLLMTNDGELADKLSHPRNNIVKLYNVELNKSLTQGDLNKISFGLELEDGFIKPDSISYVTGGSKREVGIQIHSGKNRIVRRIFESLGYEVVKLDRSVYANLTKKDLPRGRWRFLEEKEIIQLKHLV